FGMGTPVGEHMTNGYGEFTHNPHFSRLLNQLHGDVLTLLHYDRDRSAAERTTSIREGWFLMLEPLSREDRLFLGRHLGIELPHYTVVDLVATLQHFSSMVGIPTSSHVRMTIRRAGRRSSG